MIISTTERAAHLNELLGLPYQAGGMGPDAFDCYGLARHLQRTFFDRDLPVFQLPAEAGRFAVASAIAIHPERARWQEIDNPRDGAMVVMARQDCGFHIGVWLAINQTGGIVAHTIEQTGVVADTPWQLTSPAGRWRLQYYDIQEDCS